MEAKTAEASSVKKRKQVDNISQLIKAKLVQLNKKPRRRVVIVSNEESTVREAKEESDGNAVCRNPSCSGSDHVDDGTSCCSSNDSSELVEDGGDDPKLVDLKVGIETFEQN